MLAYFSVLICHFSLVNQNIRCFCDGTNKYHRNVEGDCAYPEMLTEEGWAAAAEHWAVHRGLPGCEQGPVKKDVLVTYI